MTDKERIKHIVEAIVKIEDSLQGISKDEFLRNEDKKDACYGRMVMLSEAVSKLSNELKNKYPEMEWHLITGFRNIIVHEYFKVNWHIVWSIATEDLPALKQKIQDIENEI